MGQSKGKLQTDQESKKENLQLLSLKL